MNKRYILGAIASLSVGWMVLYADRTALYPLLTIIAGEFGLTGTQTGLIMSAYFTVYVIMQIPSGIIGDRLGLKRFMVMMYAVTGLALLFLGLKAESFAALLVFIALTGLGAGAYYPSSYGITMHIVPQEFRGLSSAVVNTGTAFGLALGLAASGPLYLVTRSWRLIFLMLAVPTLVMALVFQRFLKDPETSRLEGNAIKKNNIPVGRIIRNKNILLVTLIQFCQLFGFWTAVTWGSVFFQTERGLGLGSSGAYVALITVCGIPAMLITGFISDRIGKKRLAMMTLPFGAAAIAALAYVETLPALIAALLVYGLLGKYAWDPIGVSWIGEFTLDLGPGAMGTTLGFFNFVGMSSAVIAPLVCGFIQDITGSLQGAFYLGSLLSFAGFVMLIFVDDKPARMAQKSINA